jgi:hypothetical protein
MRDGIAIAHWVANRESTMKTNVNETISSVLQVKTRIRAGIIAVL